MATQLEATIHLPANPDNVLEMFCDPQYIATKAQDALEGSSAVTHEGAITTVTLTRTWPVELPAALQSMLGRHITVTEIQRWNRATEPYSADIEVSVKGAPAKVTGTIMLEADGEGTTIHCVATASVAVPIFGKQAEQIIAREFTSVLDHEQAIGQTWLSR